MTRAQSPDPELKKRLEELPKDNTISDAFRVVSQWEPKENEGSQ
jgi:hypothetical protein